MYIEVINMAKFDIRIFKGHKEGSMILNKEVKARSAKKAIDKLLSRHSRELRTYGDDILVARAQKKNEYTSTWFALIWTPRLGVYKASLNEMLTG